MGEHKDRIHLTGCPAIDLLTDIDLTLTEGIFERYKGVGTKLNENQPYMIVLQHPVTTEFGEGGKQITETLEAVRKFAEEKNIQVVWLWPNVDAGSDDISKTLRKCREENMTKNIHFYKNFSPEDYARLLANCKMIVGNSSSGLREGAYLGVPCVNIGSRQNNRERSENVLNAEHKRSDIYSKMMLQYEKKKYNRSLMFGEGNSGKKMVDILENIDISIKKELNYIK